MWKPLSNYKKENVISDNLYVAYTFIPTLVELYNTGEYSDEMLRRKMIWIKIMDSILDSKRKIQFDDFYIAYSSIDVKMENFLVYIRFPKVKMYMGIKEACIVVDSVHKHASYFTNEYRFNCCCVCQHQSRYVRQMIGICIPDSDTPDAFLANSIRLERCHTSMQPKT